MLWFCFPPISRTWKDFPSSPSDCFPHKCSTDISHHCPKKSLFFNPTVHYGLGEKVQVTCKGSQLWKYAYTSFSLTCSLLFSFLFFWEEGIIFLDDQGLPQPLECRDLFSLIRSYIRCAQDICERVLKGAQFNSTTARYHSHQKAKLHAVSCQGPNLMGH